jgi:hypothetical protein
MAAENNNSDKKKYLFNTDILIEAESNGRALEKLLHTLNSDEITDYLIKEGIQLGKSIEEALRETIRKQKPAADNKSSAKRDTKSDVKPTVAAAAPAKADIAAPKHDPHRIIWESFQSFKENNTLVRLSVVKGKGIKLSIPCRIVNVDPHNGNVSVYHVDEKQVYMFKINEIDDYTTNK